MTTYKTPLKEFIKAVIATAKAIPERDRIGDHLVYISDVHQELSLNGIAMRLSEFKKMIAEAYRQDMIVLSKADLPRALDQTKYKLSETNDRSTHFTFIRI